jgi:hypothetical protein
MAKWADYGVCAVRYNSSHTHIDRVKIRPDNGDTIGAAAEHSRANIVEALKRGVTFVTILQDGSGKWVKGQTVFIIRVNGVEYIKTVDNSRAVDNLENLPEF